MARAQAAVAAVGAAEAAAADNGSGTCNLARFLPLRTWHLPVRSAGARSAATFLRISLRLRSASAACSGYNNKTGAEAIANSRGGVTLQTAPKK
eukprot:gene18959-biopygen8434